MEEMNFKKGDRVIFARREAVVEKVTETGCEIRVGEFPVCAWMTVSPDQLTLAPKGRQN